MSKRKKPDSTKAIVTKVKVSFDYANLVEADRKFCQAAAGRILDKMERTVTDTIAIGQDLLAVKDKLPHGDFLPWIAKEFRWKSRTAQKMMAVALKYAPHAHLNADLEAAYTLSAPGVPPEVFEDASALNERGERITDKKAKAIIKKHKPKPIKRSLVARWVLLREKIGVLAEEDYAAACTYLRQYLKELTDGH